MPVPLTFLVVVAAQEAGDPALGAFAEATRESLGRATHVLVTATEDAKADDAPALERQYHADAIVFFQWTDAAREHAQVRVHRSSSNIWIIRDIRFAKADRVFERGRAIGFTVASMFPEEMATAAEEAAKPPTVVPSAPAPDVPTPREVPPPTRSAEPAAERQHAPRTPPTVPTAPATRATSTAEESPPPSASDHEWAGPRYGSIAAGVVGALGIGGAGGGLGGTLRGELLLGRYVGIRALFAGRAGDVGAAASSSYSFAGGLGVGLHAIEPTAGRPWALGFGIDALVLRQQLSHFDHDEPTAEVASRFLPGAEFTVSGAWFFAAPFGLFVDLGAEVGLGTTAIYVRGAEVATIPPVHAISAVGVIGEF